MSSYLILQPYRFNLECLNQLSSFLLKHKKQPMKATRSYTDSNTDLEIAEIHSQLREDFVSLNNLATNKLLYKMWKQSKYCDLIICVSNSEYLAHRLALSFCSEKYKRYFEANKDEFISRLVLTQTSSAGIQAVLNYIYTNKIAFSIKTAEPIIACSKELELNRLISFCESELLNLLNTNPIRVLSIAFKFDLKQCFDCSFQHVCDHFDECVQHDQFLTLVPELILKLFFNTAQRNEIVLLERTLNWIQFNLNRYSYRTGILLLNEIHFNEISPAQIEQIAASNYFLLQTTELNKYFQEKKNDAEMYSLIRNKEK